MKTKAYKLAVAALVVALAGCATKQFPQAADVTDTERSAMTCHDIDLEIAKVQGTQQAIDTRAQFSAADVFAFLGDFGIGNVMAKDNAEKTVQRRTDELTTLRATKNCPLATTAGVTQ